MAFRFRKNCERSDGILQRFLNPTEDTLNDEYIEQTDDGDILVTTPASRASKDSRVTVVSSDCGLYEYRPPLGLNVKLVKNDTTTRVVRTPATSRRTGGGASTTATATPSEHTIYLKSEPLNDDDSLDENDCIDVLYDMDSNFEDSCDADRPITDPLRVTSSKSMASVSAASDQNAKLMQIKPVRTNKIRLGYTSSNKGKNSALASSTTTKSATAASMATAATSAKGKSKENGSKENATTNRSPKSKTNAKGEPKQPKECEICGNTYTYQHALERYTLVQTFEIFFVL